MKKIVCVVWVLMVCLPGFSQPAYTFPVRQFIDYNSEVTALTHCLLVDVIHLREIPDQTVIIRKGMIESVGDASKTPVPAGAKEIDLTGKSLLPGFVLMHEHMYYTAYSLNPFYVQFKQLPVTFPKLYLACGATTIRTAGSVEPYSDLNLKRDIDLGKIAGPDMEVTGPYLEGKGTIAPQLHELGGPAEAKAFVNFWADQGATSFKAYNYLDRATLKAAIDAAHARGCKVTGHLCSITYKEAAEMGIDQLEHGFLASTDFIPGKKEDQCISSADPLAAADLDGPAVKELIGFLVSHKVTITSTLAVFEGIGTLDTAQRPEVLAAMAPDTREMFVRYYNKGRSPVMNRSIVKDMKMEKMFVDAGGLLTVGTDPTGNGGVLAGYGSQRAIELLVGEGFTPLEAIRIATYNGARAMGMENRIGSIGPGKQADLVVIGGDVAQNIQNIRKVVWVFKKGVGFNSQKLFDNVKGQVGKF
ncbi:MAG TPA: amidohydrolase family protein [Puia sp.]|nr:amidohydrolase family protein [Puia sp.]